VFFPAIYGCKFITPPFRRAFIFAPARENEQAEQEHIVFRKDFPLRAAIRK